MPDSLLPQNADYTDKDFDSIRRRLFTLIRSVFPTWTDESVANFGNLLVELNAWIADVLGFYQDNQALESRITTAVQRKNLIALAKLINYEPATARAAQARVRFTADPPPPASDPVILGGSINPFPITVKTGDADAVEYELQHTVTMTDTEPSAWGIVENSKSFTETFTATGLPNQELVLSRTPYLDGTAVVTATNGGYEEVDHFLNSIATSRHYTVEVDNLDVATLRFGNQVSGQVPSGTIIVTYKTGGGSRANVESEAIKTIDGSFRTESGFSATVLVLNEDEPATGGLDRENEAQIREKAPMSVRVLTRAVCREDFELLAKTVGGMGQALMLTSSEDADVPVNQGNFYVIPAVQYLHDVGFPTASQMDAVYQTIRSKYPWPSTFNVQMKMPVFVDIAVRAVVYLQKGYTREQVKASAITALKGYFSLFLSDGSTNPLMNFGYYYQSDAADSAKVLPLSDLMNAVRDIAGVQRLGTGLEHFTVSATIDANNGLTPVRLSAGSHQDIPIKSHEFPRYDGLVLVEGNTGVEF